LRRNLLVAQSRLWITDPALLAGAESFAAETLQETEDELDKVRIGGIEEIRLTSRRGEIPIEIFNGTDYDVAVNIKVLSADLRLNETLPEVLQPGRFRQLTVDVSASSSGIFPVEVSVETPDGSYEIDRKSITVRSTEFNEIALVITLGALAFLIVFYVMRWFRRREPEDEAAA
ncbi:MAG TPA: DUF6049 family protein, partial [Actinomycetota bacterium]|nr:DUF6049 family protein [Actinomycetota bacterium]